jgi:hypothetical protein
MVSSTKVYPLCIFVYQGIKQCQHHNDAMLYFYHHTPLSIHLSVLSFKQILITLSFPKRCHLKILYKGNHTVCNFWGLDFIVLHDTLDFYPSHISIAFLFITDYYSMACLYPICLTFICQRTSWLIPFLSHYTQTPTYTYSQVCEFTCTFI